MPLTPEEIQSLEIDRANAKTRCHESWQVLLALEKITKCYWKEHDRWKKRFEEADYALAMERREIITLEKKKKRVTVTLTKSLSKDELETLLEELEEEIDT